MRRFLAVLSLFVAVACGDDENAIRGMFDLVELDGQPLPRPVTIDGVDYAVTSGSVNLHTGDILSWAMTIDPTAPGSESSVVVSDFFRQVTGDSLTFPGAPVESAEFFGRVSDGVLTIVTIPLTGSASSFADQVGGAHTWRFEIR